MGKEDRKIITYKIKLKFRKVNKNILRNIRYHSKTINVKV
jgi:hypothetical protein